MADTSLERYLEELGAWRAEQERSLRAPDSWLSLAGLFWLSEGANSVGSDEGCAIRLDPAVAPALVGEICLREGVVSLSSAGEPLLLNGAPAELRPLQTDERAAPDVLSVGRVTLQIIRRGERLGVRVRDPEHPSRAAFTGRRWHAPRADYRLSARFEPYDPPRPLAITNILGDTSEQPSPGALVFTLEGRELRLDATAGYGGGLQILFRDRSSGGETYGAGRYLSTPPPAAGLVELDFNRAYNPPCAFTSFATCPLPPFQNHLPVAIQAGELAPLEQH